MTEGRPRFSVCVPIYNRSKLLIPLLESVLCQSYENYELVLCEDCSPEREQVREIVHSFQALHPARIRYVENVENLGYDGNIRKLVAQARGEYCFFLGNDDLMCPNALARLDEVLNRYPDTGFVLRSYSWFYTDPKRHEETIRYFPEEMFFSAGEQAIRICFRRSGVISGYVVHRDDAFAASTSRFDGSLYYQMHLTASVLARRPAVSIPEVLVLCRASEPPDFGNSAAEKGRYTPGRYTPEARFHMIQGAVSIIHSLRDNGGPDVIEPVMHDYGNYFYAYIKDQLRLPKKELWKLYRSFGLMGFDRYPLFHVYFALGAILGESKMDLMIHLARVTLKRTPRIGI